MAQAPASFTLEQNYPNPFNPSTWISYTMSAPGQVRLSIYDALGRQVATLADGYRAAGAYAVSWDATDMPSGMYFYRLESALRVVTRSMVLLR